MAKNGCGAWHSSTHTASSAATRPGVANLGTNPTFGAVGRRLETHLFDFAGDLYGRRIQIALEQRLRGEVKFPSVQELVAQIRKDAASAREVLGVTS